MIINCRFIADRILDKIRAEAEGRSLCLASVLVGDDERLKKFVELKRKAAESVGIGFKSILLPADASQEDLEKEIIILDNDSSVDGIFIELPLPSQFSSQKALDVVVVDKDVDVLSTQAKELFRRNKSKILPPTVAAIKAILEEFNVDPHSKKIAIWGMGNLVGEPASVWFKANGAEIFEIDEFTKEPSSLSIEADIIIAGVGKPGLIKSDMVKSGAVVIDFGYGLIDGKVAGDVDVDVATKAGLMTPVPGGVGSIMIAALLENVAILDK